MLGWSAFFPRSPNGQACEPTLRRPVADFLRRIVSSNFGSVQSEHTRRSKRFRSPLAYCRN